MKEKINGTQRALRILKALKGRTLDGLSNKDLCEAMGMVKAFSFVQKLATVENWEQPPSGGCVLKCSRIKLRTTLTTQLFQPACVKIALFFYYLNVIFLLKIFYLSIMFNIIPHGRESEE